MSDEKREQLNNNLKALVSNNTTDAKIKVLDKVAQVYAEETDMLSKSEVEIIEDIFRVLLKAAEKQVRVAVSQAVKSMPHLPKDIALSLARDIDEVALPVIESSTVLGEDDLLGIVNSTTNLRRLIAIAKRESVSPAVSDALVDKNEEVSETLLKNFGSQLTEETYSKIINKSGGSETIVRAMVEKGNMPVSVLEKLLQHVSGTIRKELDNKYQVVFESLDAKRELERSFQEATDRVLTMRASHSKHQLLVQRIRNSSQFTPFAALASGSVDEFERVMARITRVPIENVRLLLADAEGLGFRALYAKAGLPDMILDSTYAFVNSLQVINSEGIEGQAVVNGHSKVDAAIERVLANPATSRLPNFALLTDLLRCTRRPKPRNS